MNGWKAYILKEKFKLLKSFLRLWNREHFRDIESSISTITKGISVLDCKAEQTNLTEEEIDKRRRLFQDLWRYLKMKESLLYQKKRLSGLGKGTQKVVSSMLV